MPKRKAKKPEREDERAGGCSSSKEISIPTVEDLICPGVCELGRCGLNIARDLTFEEWKLAGRGLRAFEGGVLWWIGDWLNYGEKTYGSKYSEAMEQTDYDYQTLRHAKSLSEKIPLCRRRHNLPWSFHQEVAALEPSEQDTMLDKAESEGWSQKELRAEVRAKRVPVVELEPDVSPFLAAAQRAFQKLGKEDRLAFLEWLKNLDEEQS